MKDAKIIERIRKLYAMSQDTSSANEAAIAAKRARSLMDQHGVQLSDLETSDMSEQSTSANYRAMPSWYSVLALGVARYNDTIVKRIGGTIVFSGYDVDVAGSILMLDYLITSMDRHLKDFKNRTGMTGRAESGSFRTGYSGDMQARLTTMADQRKAEQREAAKAKAQAANDGSTALVLVEEKAKSVAAKFGRQREKSSRASYSSGFGYGAGVKASQRTNINRQVNGGAQRALT